MADCFDCGLSIHADHVPRMASGQAFHPTPSHCVSALLANCDGMKIEVARLTSELAAARRDADRYLWLRDYAMHGEHRHLSLQLEPIDWDKYIDRAIAARSAGGGA